MVKKFLKERLGTIIFLLILAAFLLWGSASIKEARNNAITFSNEYEAPEKTADLLADGEYVSIAKTDQLELYYNDVKGAIQVVNLKNGYVWKSIVDEEMYALKKINKQWAAYLQSAITIKYNDLKKRDSGVKTLYAGKDCGYLESNPIENGVAVTYGFLTPGIYITVEYTLEDDNLVVRVPYDKIQELSKFAVTTIELLPFMGSCGNNLDGYIFYPDGSGAITTFAKTAERPSNVKFATYYTYSHKNATLMNMFQSNIYDRYASALPVCGIKSGENAMLAFATEGCENTGVVVYPSGIVVDLNHVGFELYTRNVYNVDMYNISSGTDTVSTGGQVQRVDKMLIPETKEVRYAFLTGEEANYGGMAACYRDYLIEKGMLVKADNALTNALALKLLMGTTKGGIIFDEYIKMTDFNQVIEIAEYLKNEGVTNVQMVLEGWQKDYDEYEIWGPDSHLGGKSGLDKVSEYAKSQQNLNVYLENTIMFATSKTSGIDKKEDVAYNGLNIEVALDMMDEMEYLLNPYKISRRNTYLLNKVEKYDGYGISYNDLGQYAYTDFNAFHSYLKSEMVKEVGSMLKNTSDKGRNIGIRGANQYTYAYADYLYNLREDCYGLSITDYAVPFVQMVISGYIPYSSENAGNLAYDLQTQKLKWIEFGSMPYFYLTKESALKLRDTGRDTLFSSTFEDWVPLVVDTYKEFQSNLSSVSGKQMVNHEILSEDVRRVTYENGIIIYINYSNSEQKADGYTIPAKNYIVTGGTK